MKGKQGEDYVTMPPGSGDVLLIDAFTKAAQENPETVGEDEMFIAALKLVTMMMQTRNRARVDAIVGEGVEVCITISPPKQAVMLA